MAQPQLADLHSSPLPVESLQAWLGGQGVYIPSRLGILSQPRRGRPANCVPLLRLAANCVLLGVFMDRTSSLDLLASH